MHVSITTPRGSVLQAEADEVSAPGEQGEFGILPGHIPFVSALKPGVLLCKTREGQKALAVGNGILQVSSTGKQERVVVLVDVASTAQAINREEVARELAELDKQLAQAKGEVAAELATLTARRAWAQAQLDVATRTGT